VVESTAGLDPEVGERGLAFMEASLTSDNRGGEFAPEQEAPPGADPYTRIAAFADARSDRARQSHRPRRDRPLLGVSTETQTSSSR
jgi:hypothetical protein